MLGGAFNRKMSSIRERESLSHDTRGILRGKCKMCSCSSYQSKKGLLCDFCQHPPAKHEKNPLAATHVDTPISTPMDRVSDRSYVRSKSSDKYCLACGKPAYRDNDFGLGSFNYCSSSCRDQGLLPQYNLKLKDDIINITHGMDHAQSTDNWPSCVACDKPVYRDSDSDLGFFKYCSSSCRDQDFLPKYNIKLEDDISSICPPATQVQSHVQHLPRSEVNIDLCPKEKLTLLLEEEKDSQHNRIVCVVGARNEKLISLLCSHQLFLLDSILYGVTEFNTTPTTFESPDDVYDFANPKTKLKLGVGHKRAITDSIDPFFNSVKNKNVSAVFCLKKSSIDYGFKVDGELKVKYVYKDSDAERLGLAIDDKIVVYTIATDHKMFEVIVEPSFHKFEMDISRALKGTAKSDIHLVIGVVH